MSIVITSLIILWLFRLFTGIATFDCSTAFDFDRTITGMSIIFSQSAAPETCYCFLYEAAGLPWQDHHRLVVWQSVSDRAIKPVGQLDADDTVATPGTEEDMYDHGIRFWSEYTGGNSTNLFILENPAVVMYAIGANRRVTFTLDTTPPTLQLRLRCNPDRWSAATPRSADVTAKLTTTPTDTGTSLVPTSEKSTDETLFYHLQMRQIRHWMTNFLMAVTRLPFTLSSPFLLL